MTSISSLYQIYLNHRTICTDTRNITDGCLFFALKGDRFDANSLASEALQRGAAFAVIDNEKYLADDKYILVNNSLSALQALAQYHRERLNIPVIGLTGTNGKTTTKELINAVLSSRYKTFATRGNLNNHIGVPLSILSITAETEIAVIEMGANHQKEIEFLCGIAQPTHGLITNVGLAHLEGFGGFEGVKKGKGELYTYLRQRSGTVFVNSGNHHLIEMSKVSGLTNIIWYGTKPEDYVQGQLVNADPLLEITWNRNSHAYSTTLNITGAYNFENILAAICLGSFFEVDEKSIVAGLEGYIPQNNRSQIHKTYTNTVICDFYNANPSSMSAALRNLIELSSAHKTVILGDMFELGDESPSQHDQIAREAEATKPDRLLLIGKEFYSLSDKYDALFFNTPDEAANYLSANPVRNSLVLLKGSRGMALEKLLPLL